MKDSGGILGKQGFWGILAGVLADFRRPAPRGRAYFPSVPPGRAAGTSSFYELFRLRAGE